MGSSDMTAAPERLPFVLRIYRVATGIIAPLAGVLVAYGKGDVQSFNHELTAYQDYLKSLNLPETKTTDFEIFVTSP